MAKKRINERTVEAALVSAVAARGGKALKIFSPVSAGMPDRLVLLPGGRSAWVELKAPGCKPRPLQLITHDRLRALGQRVYVVDSLETIDSTLDEI